MIARFATWALACLSAVGVGALFGSITASLIWVR